MVVEVVVDEGGRIMGGRWVGDRAVILTCEEPSEGIKTLSHALRITLLALAKHRYLSSTLASKQEDAHDHRR